MNKLWKIIKAHVNDDFIAAQYFTIFLFLGIGLTINYTVNLENGIIDSFTGKPIRVVWYFLLYGFAYYVGLFITLFFQKKLTLLKSKQLWIFSLAGLLVLAWSTGFPYHSKLMMYFFSTAQFYSFINTCVHYAQNLANVSLPLFLLAYVLKDKTCFGFTRNNIDLKPYCLLLLFLLPVVGLGSFDAGFQSYYPTYPSNSLAELLHWPMFVPVIIYEALYGLDFFNVEFLFRGFMVIGLSKLLGKEAIIPMVCVYCFLHFGKPAGEAISSIFGGYALGIIAYYTRNIWGGIMIHVGIAWAMELASYVQKY